MAPQERQMQGIIPNNEKQQEPKYFVEHLKLVSSNKNEIDNSLNFLSFTPNKLKNINIKTIFLHEHNMDMDHLNGSKVKLAFCQVLIVDKSEDSVEDSDVQMFKVALRKKETIIK